MATINEKGHEVNSLKPAAAPLGFKKPLPVAELVRRMVIRELSTAASKRGHESFEEADDFEVGDDPEIRSKYELDEDQANAKFIPEEPNDKTGTVDKASESPAGPSTEGKAAAMGRRKSDSDGAAKSTKRKSKDSEDEDDE